MRDGFKTGYSGTCFGAAIRGSAAGVHIRGEWLSTRTMADPHRDESPELIELARAVRDLTERVRQLERRVDHEVAYGDRDVGAQLRRSLQGPKPAQAGLESRIGSQWLNRVGVIAVLFGVAYLLRYAFVNKWISPVTWVWLGVCTGVALVAGSEAFRRQGYRALSLSLKATGIGVTYLSFWAARELYNALSGPQTFAALLVLTIAGAALALRESSEALAAMALIGGFLTPLLISIPTRQAPLFSYLAMLDCGAAVTAVRRDWWRLVPLSFAGSLVLGCTWYVEHYTASDLVTVVAAATLYFAIFCAISLHFRRQTARPSRLLIVFEVINPATYVLTLWLLLSRAHNNVFALAAVILSILYFVLARGEAQSGTERANTAPAIYGGLGISSIAVAIAAVVDTDWLSLGWFVEAAVVIAIGFWKDLPWLRWGALVLLCATVVKAFAFDVWQLSLGYRTLSFVTLGVLLLVISFVYQRHGLATIFRTGKDPAGRVR